jgi:putative ABC transport system ATP-binding protein
LRASLLDVTGVRVSFSQPTGEILEVLTGAACHLEAGEVVALMGPNGSGKTTLLNVASGILVPEAGQVAVDGVDVTTWPRHKRGRLMGYVHQESYKSVASDLTVAEVVVLSSRRRSHLSLSLAWVRDEYRASLDRWPEIADLLGQRAGVLTRQLSGGQRQLLAFVSAVAGSPPVLLLDEHRASLDAGHQGVVDTMLRSYVGSGRSCAVVATHDSDWARARADRILHLDGGSIRDIRPEASVQNVQAQRSPGAG